MPNYSARRVYWATQETVDDFVPTQYNSAGSFDLATEGVILAGTAARGLSLIFTSVDLWSMTYTGGDFVYSFKQEGTNCGIVAPAAFAVVDKGVFWMGTKQFFVFEGFVQPLQSEVSDYVFSDFNEAQTAKIWTLANPLYGEITWFYCSSASSEIDRYVTYNYQENHWSYGGLSRTAGITRQSGQAAKPVMVDATGNVFDHETGNITPASDVYLESGPMLLDDGDRVVRVQKIIPDDKTEGDVTATLYGSLEPNLAETSQGPVTLTSPTSVRMTARQFRLRLQGALSTSWRVGIVRLSAIVGGGR